MLEAGNVKTVDSKAVEATEAVRAGSWLMAAAGSTRVS